MKDENKNAVQVVEGKFQFVDPKLITLDNIAGEMIAIRDSFGDKYLYLCRWIRTNAIGPKDVRQVLAARGFIKQRITEINRVAQVPDELWKEYEARRMGIKMVLLLDRGGDYPNEVHDVSQTGGDAAEGDGDGAGGADGKTQAEKDEAKKKGVERAANLILKAGEHFNWQKRKWTLQNGWFLELRKESKAERKAREAKAASKKQPSKQGHSESDTEASE